MTELFVFGSNLAGRHGTGAATDAMEQHGARWGIGVGRYGFSYAIPTKDEKLKVLPLTKIKHYVAVFVNYAKAHPDLTFNMTAIGTGYAGYQPSDIAPLFGADLPA